MMIGILDCGLGGLTVARTLCDRLPEHGIVYFGDNARGPYGNLSVERIIRYTLENVKYLEDRGVDIIAVSSHAISAVALTALKDNLALPILDIVSPTVKSALETTRFQRIGVIGSRAVIGSAAYQKQILAECPEARVHCSQSPLLEYLIEQGWLKKPETRRIAKKYLLPLKTRQVDTLIPAGGHYAAMIETIRIKIGKRARVIDPSSAMARRIESWIGEHPVENTIPPTFPTRLFLLSDITEHTQKAANLLYGKKVNLEAVK